MAKVPIAGTVKTRLQPDLTPKQSAELAECFLIDTIKKCQLLNYQLILAYSPLEKKSYFESFSKIILFPQKGKILGEKIENAFKRVEEKDFKRMIMIGTDSPQFPDKRLMEAFKILENKETVIGKTTDGGFYLIGLRKTNSSIFKNIEWSSENTFQQLLANIKSQGLSYGEVSEEFDIDYFEDLKKLQRDFRNNPNLEKTAPLTCKWLVQNRNKFFEDNEIEKQSFSERG